MSTNPVEVKSIRDVQELVKAGFDDWPVLGDVRVVEKDRLLLFSYQHPKEWNAFECMSRGLIIEKGTGFVVARPFDKFFNWGEGGRTTGAPIESYQEKMDGSLIIVYWYNGAYHTATRGAFDSPQAQWAREYLDEIEFNLNALSINPRFTFLFEAIYPGNRIVVDYGPVEALFLLSMRDRYSGNYASYDFVKTFADSSIPRILMPRTYGFSSPDEAYTTARALPATKEGYVAVFTDGSRFKFKSAAYLELHKIVFGLNYNRAVEAVRDGRVEEIREVVPEELRVQFDAWVEEITRLVSNTLSAVEQVMDEATAAGYTLHRKTFALWATNRYPGLLPYLFAALDSKPVEPLIYHIALKEKG